MRGLEEAAGKNVQPTRGRLTGTPPVTSAWTVDLRPDIDSRALDDVPGEGHDGLCGAESATLAATRRRQVLSIDVLGSSIRGWSEQYCISIVGNNGGHRKETHMVRNPANSSVFDNDFVTSIPPLSRSCLGQHLFRFLASDKVPTVRKHDISRWRDMKRKGKKERRFNKAKQRWKVGVMPKKSPGPFDTPRKEHVNNPLEYPNAGDAAICTYMREGLDVNASWKLDSQSCRPSKGARNLHS
jgi:hypothetical protein